MGVTLAADIEIARRTTEVFGFMDDPEAVAQVTPGVSRVETAERGPEGGLRCRVVYELLDRDWSVDVACQIYAPTERLSYSVTGLLTAELNARFTPIDEGTHLELWGHYELPETLDLPPLRKLARGFTDWAMARMVQSLKAELER